MFAQAFIFTFPQGPDENKQTNKQTTHTHTYVYTHPHKHTHTYTQTHTHTQKTHTPTCYTSIQLFCRELFSIFVLIKFTNNGSCNYKVFNYSNNEEKRGIYEGLTFLPQSIAFIK